jgi:signal transduction histidine kinase
VNDFLSKLKIGESGQTFIMERSGELIASSTKSRVFKGDSVKDSQAERVMASESENEFIRLTAEHLEEHFGSLQKITDSQQLDFKIGNARQFVQVAPLMLGDKRKGGLDFLVVVTIPEADFMGRITANTNVSVAMSLFALILTILIGLLTARWIIQPILTLNDATKSFAAGNWDQTLPIERSDELGELAKSFNSMGEQVKKSFLALEEANATLEQKVKERTQELSVALEELKASQAQLVQSKKMASLGQMVAGVAHEINTPLGYIKSNVEMTKDLFTETEDLVSIYDSLIHLLMSEDVGEEELNSQLAVVTELSNEFRNNETFHETKELLKDIIYGLDQISELVVNLKDFSRLDQARVADINLNECLDSVLVIGHNVIGNKVQIEKQYTNIPMIQCSPSHINQVFLNIVTNAAQAMDKTGTIYLRTRADDENVYIEIEDTGKGIPEDVIAKIFDPFFTTKPIGEGTGLGLSICYQIIEQHNGEIKVASEVGKGTTFTISLPRQAPSSSS